MAPPKAPPKTVSQSSQPAVDAPEFAMPEKSNIPPRILLNAMEGWGKTTLAAQVPGVALIQSRGETGYQTLFDSGLVSEIPTLEAASWKQLMAVLDRIITSNVNFTTLAIDVVGGVERLCHEYVCDRDFGGDWGHKGFTSYMQGYHVSVSEWLIMLQKLDKIRSKGIGILLLGHCLISTFKNPTGEDFDRYQSDMHQKTFAETRKWCDAVLFGMFETIVDKISGKSKGIGGTERTVKTERTDTWDAKNRLGMPSEIRIPSDRNAIWETISQYIPYYSKGTI